MSIRVLLSAVTAMLAMHDAAVSQEGPAPRDAWQEVFVGSEIESYLRNLQVAGRAPAYPWSVRGFSPAEADHLLLGDGASLPWSSLSATGTSAQQGFRWAWVPPRFAAVYNSTFPSGYNDGPVWAGRGLTTAVQAGFAARYGPVSLVLAPIAFRAENEAFDVVDNGLTGARGYADWRFPTDIDLPQRFGNDPYIRLDPGQTTLRLDLAGLSAGVSTANQHWGPASEYPLLLGNNAPGFQHGFVGTASPLDLWVARVHGRVVWGKLEQSEYSLVQGIESRRFMSGVVGVLLPRGAPGLEIGGARFFHTPWPAEGLTRERFLKPLEGLLKIGLVDGSGDPTDVDNQLASLFFRWVPPRSGIEVYGEYGREDHGYDLRDISLEPDHSSAYVLGFRRVWEQSPTEMLVLRGEVMNAQMTHISRVRLQSPWYRHTVARQGHTHRGQILGSAVGYGGGGSVLAADWYDPEGRWTVSWSRALEGYRGDYAISRQTGAGNTDVAHSLSLHRFLIRRRFGIAWGLTGTYQANRNFAGDETNLRVEVGAHWVP